MNLEEPDHWLFEKKNNHRHIHMQVDHSCTPFFIIIISHWLRNNYCEAKIAFQRPCFSSIKLASFLAGQKISKSILLNSWSEIFKKKRPTIWYTNPSFVQLSLKNTQTMSIEAVYCLCHRKQRKPDH